MSNEETVTNELTIELGQITNLLINWAGSPPTFPHPVGSGEVLNTSVL